jgi:hypothetical protein
MEGNVPNFRKDLLSGESSVTVIDISNRCANLLDDSITFKYFYYLVITGGYGCFFDVRTISGKRKKISGSNSEPLRP